MSKRSVKKVRSRSNTFRTLTEHLPLTYTRDTGASTAQVTVITEGSATHPHKEELQHSDTRLNSHFKPK